MSWRPKKGFKRFRESPQNNNLSEPLLATSYNDSLYSDTDRLMDDIDDLLADDVEMPVFPGENEESDASDNSGGGEEEESKSPSDKETRPLVSHEAGLDHSEPDLVKKGTAKVIIDEDIALSRKYESFLTIENDEIINRNDKIDALILHLKLPHIYSLADDAQYKIIQEKYPWIDDEDGEIDQFQYEEIQEVVGHMTAIERRYMYDIKENYDEVIIISLHKLYMFTYNVYIYNNRMMRM